MFDARTIAIEAHIPEQLRHARREDTQHGAARQADKQRGPGQPDVGDGALWTLGWSKIECCGLSCVCAEAWRYEGVVAGRAERKIVEKHGSAQRGQRAGRTRRTCGERAGERAGDVGLQPAKGPESDAGACHLRARFETPGHGTASCRVASVASRAPSPRPDSGPRHTPTPSHKLLTAPASCSSRPACRPTRTRTMHTFSLQYISHTSPDASMYS